jgi:hypothetical protein
MQRRIGAAVVGVLALGGVARAHHEAIFGPQSSLVLRAPAFVSVQTYTRGLGPAGARTEETNLLVSAGLQPVASVPLSFTAIVPASYITGPNGKIGLEDMVLGARWRQGLGAGGPYPDGHKKGDNLFLGGGAAWTPIDHPATEQLLSFQLGCSWEETMDLGTGVYLHPTQDLTDPAAVDHFRVGLGLVHLFK